ncbi:cupin-like domain containing protein [Nitzschia inconspicua]|uniref:Cupin-like domain containing protein n=1 Tax=Nitzschia inconspicua TaxID=303405 RepID=A0A9K3LYD4_9STRA|nr:cupin-like domain containing protein [Nitzschia inconspicua]
MNASDNNMSDRICTLSYVDHHQHEHHQYHHQQRRRRRNAPIKESVVTDDVGFGSANDNDNGNNGINNTNSNDRSLTVVIGGVSVGRQHRRHHRHRRRRPSYCPCRKKTKSSSSSSSSSWSSSSSKSYQERKQAIVRVRVVLCSVVFIFVTTVVYNLVAMIKQQQISFQQMLLQPQRRMQRQNEPPSPLQQLLLQQHHERIITTSKQTRLSNRTTTRTYNHQQKPPHHHQQQQQQQHDDNIITTSHEYWEEQLEKLEYAIQNNQYTPFRRFIPPPSLQQRPNDDNTVIMDHDNNKNDHDVGRNVKIHGQHRQHQQQQKHHRRPIPNDRRHIPYSTHGRFFRVSRRSRNHINTTTNDNDHNNQNNDHHNNKNNHFIQWKQEWQQIQQQQQQQQQQSKPLAVDYTNDQYYEYPSVQKYPSLEYPTLLSLGSIMERWPQHEIDRGTGTTTVTRIIRETLQHLPFRSDHFDVARRYIDLGLPFKFTNVPELLEANRKWTDEYVSRQHDHINNDHNNDDSSIDDNDNNNQQRQRQRQHHRRPVQGKCQESPTGFFTFFEPRQWNITELQALPPTRNNDMTFEEWSDHARYADSSRLHPNRPHFYFQTNVDRQERFVPNDNDDDDKRQHSFVSLDLPSFSSPNGTILSPSPQEQNGIQCRFGERGIITALHYDEGRNMIGMITGARRYILLPPNQCSKLSIFTDRDHPLFRHSTLNLGRMMGNQQQSQQQSQGDDYGWDDTIIENDQDDTERLALDSARHALAVETVLKAGEVLFLPSYWFHYIIGLQKNAQCNVRSGVGPPNAMFGGKHDVTAGGCCIHLEEEEEA